jgi:isopenicillin-N epimerase
MNEHWGLDPSIVFLNHGSFGACPRVVLEHQQALRAQMEAEPVRFMLRELPVLLDEARRFVSTFLGVKPADLVFVANATSGVNAVLRSLSFMPGDEILITDHSYPACRNAATYVAERSGARVVMTTVPFPCSGPGEVIEAVLSGVTANTRLALLDHVTSPTALIFPMAALCQELARKNVPVLCDGAHAPGMLELDIDAIGARYYAGNFHKWVCAPKGAGFLWVHPDHQAGLFAPNISIGYSDKVAGQSPFHAAFDWTGTADPTAFLSVPRAISFLETLLDGGLATLRAHNHGLACTAQEILCEALATPVPCPPEMLGSMASVFLPGDTTVALQDRLFFEDGIEVPVKPWSKNQLLMRVSLQAYNRMEDIHRLARAYGASSGSC